MMNWSACRSLPSEEHYAGPQYYEHRFAQDRTAFSPKIFRCADAPSVRPRASYPGWLCCDSCQKWRRVDAESLRIWDHRFFFEREVDKAAQFLRRADSGFHRRLERLVETHIRKQETVPLALLEEFLAAHTEDTTSLRSKFNFLSVVAFLRQTFPGEVENYLEDAIFLRETDLWNDMAGPVFRCDFLVNTCCSEESDDKAFAARDVDWSKSAAEFTPLLVQDVGTEEDPYAARLHRYSGVQRAVVGAHGQCCIPGCTHDFPANQPGGWTATYFKEHASHKLDVVTVKPVCDMHRKRIKRADQWNRGISKLQSQNRA